MVQRETAMSPLSQCSQISGLPVDDALSCMLNKVMKLFTQKFGCSSLASPLGTYKVKTLIHKNSNRKASYLYLSVVSHFMEESIKANRVDRNSLRFTLLPEATILLAIIAANQELIWLEPEVHNPKTPGFLPSISLVYVPKSFGLQRGLCYPPLYASSENHYHL